MEISNFFFVHKRTNDKLLFARWANGKRIKEICLNFHFPFEVSMSMSQCLSVFMLWCLRVSMSPCLHVFTFPEFSKWGLELTENGNFLYFLQTENGHGKLPFVCSKQKRKKDVSFPWSANDKRLWTIVVSANVPIYRQIADIDERFSLISDIMFDSTSSIRYWRFRRCQSQSDIIQHEHRTGCPPWLYFS